MARIKDVAQEANVSIATVSRVINNVPLVNEETRLRVLAAIKKTGYKPNNVARSLKMQRSDIIGIIVSDISRPITMQCLAGLHENLSQNGYSTIVSYTKNDKDSEKEALEMFIVKQCEGVIFVGKNINEDTPDILRKENIPAVSCLSLPDNIGIPGVGFDDYEISKSVVKYLTGKGHRKIGAFMGNDTLSYTSKRIHGFVDAMKEADIPLDKDWIIRNPRTFEGGYSSAKQICSLPEDMRPTAIYCSNDDIAIGAVKAFYNEGNMRIPDDISIMSTNGSIYSDWGIACVTTLRFDPYAVGLKGSEILLNILRSGVTPLGNEFIPFTLFEGDSVKDLND